LAIISLRSTFFLAKFAGKQGTQRGFACGEMGMKPLLHLQHETGIETNPFPPSAFRLPTWPRRFVIFLQKK
jgi:hypothetical protein